MTTDRAGLASHKSIGKFNSFAFTFGLIPDEALQLVETPVVEPSVKSFTHKLISGFPYSLKVLEHNYIGRADNLFAHIMVDPSHEAFLPARQSFKLSSSRLCAFGLEPATQVAKFPDFIFRSWKIFSIGCDSKVVYAKVYTNYFTCFNKRINFSRECNMKKQSFSSVHDKQRSLISPVKIFIEPP